MSAKENPCKKFQANIFNKSKCQNCFKPRESHLLSDEDLNQAKPIYGGWLLLAPEGTDFDNPMHRSRKWQRRFFILYEHGLLRYALDEMPTTLPQGTINMNQCTDVIDGESRTGQKFSLCIMTPEEHFIRAENKEIINGWLEMLIVYPKTNKQNQKKKRKVEPPTPQEPGPAKMAATSTGIPSAEKVPATKSTLWQAEAKGRDGHESIGNSPIQSPVHMPSSPSEPAPDVKVDGSLMNGDRIDGGRKTRVESGYFSLEKTKDLKSEEQPPTPPSPSTPDAPSRYSVHSAFDQEQDPFFPPGNGHCQPREPHVSNGTTTALLHVPNREYVILADVPRARRITHREVFQVEKKRLEQKTRARSPGREEVARLFGQQRRRSLVIEKFEALDIEKAEHMETSCSAAPSSEARQGRSEKRTFPRKRDETGGTSIPDVSACPMSPYRRAKSLDRRSTESSMTPDLLNFKKGWLTKQYQDGQWKKHWFVLTDQNLRYYRDSVAEEAADLDGEIDLSTCYDVTEYPVQRNYGFQIHTKEGEFTLSAMTSGIRRNWIQTIMKHVRPNTAPDVTRKSFSLKLSVLKPSSLPEEKSKTASSFVSSSIQSEKPDSEYADADGEHKRSRARERRREGRSKTFDWAEFRPIQQALAQERAQAGVVTKSISCYDTTDSKNDLGELERERTRRREERRKRFESSDSVEESTGEESSQMEVDKGPACSDPIDIRPNVHVEIEQRWQQVETTPLREEKQIPIAPLPLSNASPKRTAEDITVLLEKQLEQSQREVSDLLAENLVLQQRLKEALEQQHNARDGYVLQTELADPSSDAWQRLHKVNEDLQNELEAQHKRQEMLSHQLQSIKHSYGEAKDTIRHHEAEIMNLQARLSSASAELSIKEQALTKLKGDLKLEREKAYEMLEEWKNSEVALSSQLKVCQQKLKEVESLLLEKRQEIRELEMQQALQKDYQKEAQRLQDKLAILQAQLDASEQAQILTEERLQMNYEQLLESYEKEKQLLIRNLKETEARLVEYEDKLQEKDQVMEILQKEKLNDSAEVSVLVHHLEEQLVGRDAAIQRLKECITELEVERDHLRTTCQEMVQQIAGSDSDISSLQNRIRVREIEYEELRSSLEKSTDDILKVQEALRGKEEELKNVYDAHSRLMGKKDQDINEALIKMAALGSSLEDTEIKLKAKEEALISLGGLCSDSQAKEIESVYLQLESAKRRISEMEQCLQAEGGDVCGDVSDGNDLMVEVDHEEPLDTVDRNASLAEKEHDTGVKRQRIRFSSIQCQRYAPLDCTEKTWTCSPPSDINQEGSISPEMTVPDQSSGANDLDSCLSIIHSLESKLYITEENLKDLTLKLENENITHQETLLALHGQWANAEASLKEQLQASISQVNAMTNQMEEMQKERLDCPSDMTKREIICCLDACCNLHRELHEVDESRLTSDSLASIKHGLSGIIKSLQRAISDSSDHQNLDRGCQEESRLQSSQNPVHRLSEKINFQAQLMYRMVESLRRPTSETDLQVQEGERKRGPSTDYLVEMFARKIKLERDFWDRVDQIGIAIVRDEGVVVPKESELSLNTGSDLLQTLTDNTLLKAELFLAIQKSKALTADLKIAEAAVEGLSVEDMGTNPSGSQKMGHHHILDCEPYSSENTSIACLEELSLHLKENADELKRISCALMSISSDEGQGAIESLLQTHQQICSVQFSSSPSLLVQDAVVQAQLCYVAGKARLEYQRELRRSMNALSHSHSEALSKLHQDYQEILQEKQRELSEAMERERNATAAVTSQVEDTERFLGEAEEKFKETMSKLDREYKREMQTMMESWMERENALKSQHLQVNTKLQASKREREEAERFHWEKIKNLENQFQEQIQELQIMHRHEMKTLEDRYTQSIQQLQDTLDSYQREPPYTPSPADSTTRSIASDQETPVDVDSMNVLKGRILELEAQMNIMREELEQRHPEDYMSSIKKKYQADFENLKATCERGFTAMEETHQKKIEDLQRQHHRELEKLREEKDRLLAEETAATISAIEAMKNAHREEIDREREKSYRSQVSSINADVESLRRQYLEELQSVQRELEVLSEQYSQKCLENAHLAQALEAERQALRQCQRENQELNAHNQELNNRLATEITRLRNLVTGDGGEVSPLTQGKDVYELEVLLRVKESEIQYQKQEISSLKDELQTALRDKKYASDKYKDIYSELSNVKAKAECDISRLKEQLKAATEMLGDKSPENASVSGYDIMKSKSNPDFLKNDRSTINRQLRNIRSKSVIEQVSWDN
ncbi:myosin phosphatase Rho-interacting protein isoform X3 [Phyllobates terribilis]|uniref:myosin phosphatase Rho-interacting protein isoform X3 n=1 Tax=Phyllobates terribilis TaxID=111132 RepID=UPI003CCB4CD2